MLRISPSLIDSYRYWRDTTFADHERERECLDDLLASIRGEKREPTEAMARGLAWHRALEMVEPRFGLIEVTRNGHLFRFDGPEVLQIREQLPATTNQELRGRLELPEVGVVMYLRTDGVGGTIIHEHKTTERIDVDKYTRTSQWRAYLLAFDCRAVVYHIVKLKKDRKENLWQVQEYLPFTQYAYPNMRHDLADEAGELAAFIRQQGLAEYREET